MLRLLAAVLLCLPSWGAYGYKKALTIDYTKCGSASSANFPFLVSDTDADLKTVADYPNLIAGLQARGYRDDALRKLLGGNLLRVWRAVEAEAAAQARPR